MAAGSARAAGFSAGAGRADVALPAALFPIDGFVGQHDPLTARVLLLDDGTARVAIATVDLTSLSGETVAAAKAVLAQVLLERAFGTLGAGRVQFKVDARNARSLRALDKLGAVREGTLRQYQVRPDGYARDSVVYSVLRAEWPGVRAGLRARLGLP